MMSDDQDRALDGISEFLERPGVPKPFVVLQGLAGTGKTFVLARLAERFPDMKLAAYTGKAASVLRKRINRQVTTMHSAIYDFHGLVEDDDDSRRMNPIFVPKGETRTVAELGNEWKRANSHRARAAKALSILFVGQDPAD